MCNFENPHRVFSNTDLFEKYKNQASSSNKYGYTINNKNLDENYNESKIQNQEKQIKPEKKKNLFVCGDIKTDSTDNLGFNPISESIVNADTIATQSPWITPKYTSYT